MGVVVAQRRGSNTQQQHKTKNRNAATQRKKPGFKHQHTFMDSEGA
jgi:hypothetical protein